MPRALALIVATMLAFSPFRAFAKVSGPASPQEIRRTLSTYVESHPKTMIAMGAIRNGKATMYLMHGMRTAGSLNEHTLFQIGSITKTFTATLLAQMVEDGEVQLNDPIQKYLPPGITAPTYKGKPITLGLLAEHRSGLPDVPPNLPSKNPSNPYDGFSTEMLYSAVRQVRLTRPPGAVYQYSNFGFGLLGQLLANRAHTSYEALVMQRILQPLGMNDTVVIGSKVTRKLLAPGFGYGGQPQVPWDLGALSGAGSIESSLHDMLVYLKVNFEAPAGPFGAAMAFAQQPRAAEDQDDSTGLGWDNTIHVQAGWVYKAGGDSGYTSEITFNRRLRFGLVILANIADQDVDQIAAHVAFPESAAAPIPWALVKKQVSPYSGTYFIASNYGHTALSIFKYKGQLYLATTESAPEQLAELRNGRYVWQSANATITFDRNLRGDVTGLTVFQNGQITRAKKTP